MRLVVTLGSMLLALPLAAQPELVVDINTRPGTPNSSHPQHFIGFGDGRVFFTASDHEHGEEPWVTDGTAVGTRMLADLFRFDPVIAPSWVFERFGKVFFYASQNSGSVWADLFVTDGTPGEVVRLTATAGGALGRLVGTLADRGLLFFSYLTDEYGAELWVTDGTPTGTRMVHDLAPGPAYSFPAGPDFGLPPGRGLDMQGELLFRADSPATGEALWATDGTAAGTRLVADPDPTHDDRAILDLAALGDRVVFTVDDREHGREPWGSDGTAGGTELLADLVPGPVPSVLASPFTVVGDTAYFLAQVSGSEIELWKTDGSAAGTRRLAAFAAWAQLKELLTVAADGTLFFAAADGVHGLEPWVSDGTAAGTRRVADLCPGACGSAVGSIRATPLGFVFTADDGVHGREPWVSDGTAAGTRRVADLCPGACSSGGRALGSTGGGTVLLSVDEQARQRLWSTDGTPGGTLPLPVPEGFVFGQGPVAAGDRLVFGARTPDRGSEPWITDGTPGGTGPLVELSPDGTASSGPGRFTTAGPRAFFLADDGVHGPALWRSDGTAAGTRLVADLLDDTYPLTNYWLTSPVGDDLSLLVSRAMDPRIGPTFFDWWLSDGREQGTVRLAEVGTTCEDRECQVLAAGTPGPGSPLFLLGPGLWASDGTPGGTRRILGSERIPFVPSGGLLDGILYFSASATLFGDYELWRSDGTAAGTYQVIDLDPDRSASPGEFMVAGGRLYFVAFAPDRELWTTDGTAAGTRKVGDLSTDTFRDPDLVAGIGDRLLFFAGWNYLSTRRGLWATIGTAESIVRLASVSLATAGNSKTWTALVGGRLYFLASGGPSHELWVSDGTASGTRGLAALPSDRQLQGLWGTADRLLLLALNSDFRRELWVTDGTLAGSRRLGEVPATPSIAFPGQLAVVGPRALFQGTSYEFGEELWAISLDSFQPPPPELVPPAPDGLTTEPVSASTVRLTWNDRSSAETAFEVDWVTPGGQSRERIFAPADAEELLMPGFAPEVPVTFRVRALSVFGPSAWSAEAAAAPRAAHPGPCDEGSGELCLMGRRFATRVYWRDQHNGGWGRGTPAPFPGSDQTGTFTFFSDEVVELLVKELDGRPVNGFYWTFYGALSDVEYWISVLDVATGATRTYHNPPGSYCGQGDNASFPGGAGAASTSNSARRPVGGVAIPSAVIGAAGAPAAAGSCVPGPETLCLLGSRFRVEVDWHDQHNGGDGVGQAIPGTDLSGYFYFFDRENVELAVKALDGTGVNGFYWFFYGALSDVEYTIRVTDTASGLERTYRNPPGEICGQADTAAF